MPEDKKVTAEDPLLTPGGFAKFKEESIASTLREQPHLTREQAESLFQVGADLLGLG